VQGLIGDRAEDHLLVDMSRNVSGCCKHTAEKYVSFDHVFFRCANQLPGPLRQVTRLF
jgi:hypothetical protein